MRSRNLITAIIRGISLLPALTFNAAADEIVYQQQPDLVLSNLLKVAEEKLSPTSTAIFSDRMIFKADRSG